jgi:hypothetical protein
MDQLALLEQEIKDGRRLIGDLIRTGVSGGHRVLAQTERIRSLAALYRFANR